MNRPILVSVATPALVIGLLLCGTCVVSAWYINRLQHNTAHILSEDVANLEAAQELETEVRQLRFHTFLYLIDPTPARQEEMDADHRRFEEGLEEAKRSAVNPDEAECVQAIEAGYGQYRAELAEVCEEVARKGAPPGLARLTDAHPIRHVIDPCEKLIRLNQEEMDQTSQENEAVGAQARAIMLLVGILGPVGGLLSGFGVTQALRRSICRLSVRIQDIAQRLERPQADIPIASVNLSAEGDIQGLDQQLQHVLKRVEEVTERMQQHQRDMLRAEQLAAVGQLAAGVAHEIRNPLTGIKMLVELALRPGAAKPLTTEDLRAIHAEVARLERTAQGFLDFARLPTPCRAECDLREVVSQVTGLIGGRCRQQDVEVTVHSPPEAVCVSIDPDQFRTVLLNLCLNALDVMPHGGRLGVALERCMNGEIGLTVTDSGAGIPPDMIPRLFTPFQSSKPTGTGLGLSISRRIVEEHGGRLTAGNRPEGGARFTIQLPAARGTLPVVEEEDSHSLSLTAGR